MCANEFLAKKNKQFEKENKIFEKGQMVFIGDSLTDRYDLGNYYNPFLLPKRIYNRSIDGDSTNGLLQRLDNSLIDLLPTVAMILICASDLRNNINNEQIALNYESIFQRIKEKLPNTKVLVHPFIRQTKNQQKTKSYS